MQTKKRRSKRLLAWRPVQVNGTVKYAYLEMDIEDVLNWLSDRALKSRGKKARQLSGSLTLTIRDKRP